MLWRTKKLFDGGLTLMPISCHFQDCKALVFMSLLMYAALCQVFKPLPLPVRHSSHVVDEKC